MAEDNYNIDFRYKVEDLSDPVILKTICELCEIEFNNSVLNKVIDMPKNIHTGYKPENNSKIQTRDRKSYSKIYTISDIEKEDFELATKLISLSNRYGYDITKI